MLDVSNSHILPSPPFLPSEWVRTSKIIIVGKLDAQQQISDKNHSPATRRTFSLLGFAKFMERLKTAATAAGCIVVETDEYGEWRERGTKGLELSRL